MNLDIYQVDAFARATFEGNPAAVCILDSWLPDMLMQAIAAEMNLSETAFVVQKDDGYRIRWFTPNKEVKLCGHATLAAAHVLYEELDLPRKPIRFRSLSGLLIASVQEDRRIYLDFPALPAQITDLTVDIQKAVGGEPLQALAGEDLTVVYSDATEIEILTPDMTKVALLPYRGVCVTAPGNGNGYDFVCRFFAPALGINEDPVTGSVFTALAPYYQRRFGKNIFAARQMSKRGGDVTLEVRGERVLIAGNAKTVLKGSMFLK